MVKKNLDSSPPTEQVDHRKDLFDQIPLDKQLHRLLDSQLNAVKAVQNELFSLASATEEIVRRLRNSSGRLVYAGSGCSIRIGVQDGIELVPTFGWPLSRLHYLIAGGSLALSQSIEGAEDDVDDAIRQVSTADIGIHDVVIAITASGNTPFTCQVARSAKGRGALTIAITSNPGSSLVTIADHAIVTKTGAEVVAGSTRLGAGTAQKAVLNALTTVLMANLGRVLGNQMLCVQATNKKLKLRQTKIMINQISHLTEEEAHDLLVSVDWDLRMGLLVGQGLSKAEACDALASDLPFQQLFSR